MHKLQVLLAEDMAHERLVIETKLRQALSPVIEPQFAFIDSAEAAIELSKIKAFDLVILDIDFSASVYSRGMTGLEAAKAIKEIHPEIYTVVVSSNEEEAMMTKAIDQYGVDWYLRRSSISFHELAWLAKQSLLSKLHKEDAIINPKYSFKTANMKMKSILRRIDSILPNQNTLIYGETGTGKELIARRIHGNAAIFENKRPFKVLDCSAISQNLFEAEVFGHKKGAFTGAVADRPGILQLVNGGDLFLDEIHNIPVEIQQKLLRVLNDGVYTPVGSNEEIRSSFRIIAATNIPVETSIENGRLLPDFVERIRKIRVILPPLRQRKEDIKLLIESHLESLGSFDKEFSDDAISLLQDHSWLGNIRELKGILDTAIGAIKMPIVTRSHLEPLLSKRSTATQSHDTSSSLDLDSIAETMLSGGLNLDEATQKFQTAYLSRALDQYRDIKVLEKVSGYSKATLYRQFKDLGISSDVLKRKSH